MKGAQTKRPSPVFCDYQLGGDGGAPCRSAQRVGDGPGGRAPSHRVLAEVVCQLPGAVWLLPWPQCVVKNFWRKQARK